MKVGDVGQMLQVFLSDKDKSLVRNSLVTISAGGGECLPSGLTPPTQLITRNRFDLTARQKGHFLPHRVRQVLEEVLVVHPGEVYGVSGPQDKEFLSEMVEEQVVDFEDYMVDEQHPKGVTITLNSSDWTTATRLLQQHPELLEILIDEEEDELERLARMNQVEIAEKEKQLQSLKNEGNSEKFVLKIKRNEKGVDEEVLNDDVDLEDDEKEDEQPIEEGRESPDDLEMMLTDNNLPEVDDEDDDDSDPDAWMKEV